MIPGLDFLRVRRGVRKLKVVKVNYDCHETTLESFFGVFAPALGGESLKSACYRLTIQDLRFSISTTTAGREFYRTRLPGNR